jgi:hypothetical protein
MEEYKCSHRDVSQAIYNICVCVESDKMKCKKTKHTEIDIRFRHHARKNAQVVTNLQQTCCDAVPTTCQQDVFTLLVPSLLTSCQRGLVENL